MDEYSYIHVGAAQAVKSTNIALAARKLKACIDEFCQGREKALALERLEECVLWANSSISNQGWKETE